jgi:hypothetical protein
VFSCESISCNFMDYVFDQDMQNLAQ